MYLLQQSSSHITYAKVIGELKNGSKKILKVTICDGHTSKAKQGTTTGWYPLPIEITESAIPAKILAKLNK